MFWCCIKALIRLGSINYVFFSINYIKMLYTEVTYIFSIALLYTAVILYVLEMVPINKSIQAQFSDSETLPDVKPIYLSPALTL